jgi:hypothetical protein
MRSRLSRPTSFLLLLALAGCGGGGSNGDATGRLSIAVTDAPVNTNVTEVNVQFTGIEVKPANGPSIVFDFGVGNEKTIDLLQLQGDASADLIVGEEVPAGPYNWLRLLVNAERDVVDSYVEIDGSAVMPLYVPSGSQSGLKLVSGFTVPVGGDADFVIDWNLAQAIHAPAGQEPNYKLKPALRITDRVETGKIAGTVDASRIDENAVADCAGGNSVYLFSRPDAAVVAEDDLDELEDDGRADVLTTARVTYDSQADQWRFSIGFVAPGDYTAAFTCSAAADDPAIDDYPNVSGSEFDFESRADLSVAVGNTTEIEL